MSLDWETLQAIAHSASSGYGASDNAFVLSATAADGGYFPLPAAMDGETLDYYAQSVDNDEREIGKGVYTHAGLTLARADGEITRSTNSNNRVAFSAAPIVVIDWTGRLIKLLDALLNVTGSGTAAGARAALGLAIGTNVLAEQTIGIADDNLLEVDGSPNDAEYARFTANGIEGRTESEFKADFSLEDSDINALADARIATMEVVAPANFNSSGSPGQWARDSVYFYWCYDSNLWMRMVGATAGW